MGFALFPGEHTNCMPVQATASHDVEQARATSGLNGIDKSSPAPAGTPEAQRAACLRMPGWPTRNTFSNWPSGRTDVSRGGCRFYRQRESQSRPRRPAGSRCRGQAMTFHEYLSKAVQHDAHRWRSVLRPWPVAGTRVRAEQFGRQIRPPGSATVPDMATRSRAVLALVGVSSRCRRCTSGLVRRPGPPARFCMKRESDRDAGLAQPRRHCHPGPGLVTARQPFRTLGRTIQPAAPAGVACAKHGPAVRLRARPGACGHRRPSRAGHLRVRPTRQDPAPARGRRRSRSGRRGAR